MKTEGKGGEVALCSFKKSQNFQYTRGRGQSSIPIPLYRARVRESPAPKLLRSHYVINAMYILLRIDSLRNRKASSGSKARMHVHVRIFVVPIETFHPVLASLF